MKLEELLSTVSHTYKIHQGNWARCSFHSHFDMWFLHLKTRLTHRVESAFLWETMQIRSEKHFWETWKKQWAQVSAGPTPLVGAAADSSAIHS